LDVVAQKFQVVENYLEVSWMLIEGKWKMMNLIHGLN
jgi:hypothetical protein